MHVLKSLAVAGALSLAATGAWAQDSAPDWLKKPTSDDLMSVWPTKALKEGKGGRAVVTCVVTIQGTLRQCKVVSETPADAGFGSAALALSTQFLMKPARKAGQPVESSVSIPVNFPTPEKALGSNIRPVTDSPLPGTRVFSGLPFKDAPTVADIASAYPEKARAKQAGGVVSMSCTIRKDGHLGGCEGLREEPKGLGFDAAARALAPKFVAPIDNAQHIELAGAKANVVIAFSPDVLGLARPAVGKPKWNTLPQLSNLEAVTPPEARRANVYQARVVMACTVGAGGALDGCTVASEEPSALGWGAAALKLAPFFHLAVWTEEGLPVVGGAVRVPIKFDLPKPAAAPAGAP